jgi:hypothetical protein
MLNPISRVHRKFTSSNSFAQCFLHSNLPVYFGHLSLGQSLRPLAVFAALVTSMRSNIIVESAVVAINEILG